MADNSAIEWCDATWNPTVGCSVLSPGCTNCYAMRFAHRMGGGMPWSPAGKNRKYRGLTKAVNHNPVWTGVVRLEESALDWPLRKRKPLRIFVNSMSDLFHESLPDEAIDRVFAVMALAPQHTFLVLTKRSKRMREWFEERWQGTPAQTIVFSAKDKLEVPAGGGTGRRHEVESGSLKARHFGWPLPQVWLGVSVEDQARADERIPDLLMTPAAKRFISAEPLLGPIDLDDCVSKGFRYEALIGRTLTVDGDRQRLWVTEPFATRVDWVIAGGESGPGARPMHPDWARSLRDQCAGADVPFFFKQIDKKQAIPADLFIREFPHANA